MIQYLSKIIKLNNLHVVSVIKKDDDVHYHVLTIKKKGSSIDIVSTNTFKKLGELNRNLDLKLPILLLVDGKGVLNKEINFNKEDDIAWQKNIDFSTIYYTSYKTQHSSFISFCRKDIVEEVILNFQKKGFQVIDVYLGSFLAALLQGSIKKDSIISSDLILQFEADQLISFTKKAPPQKESYSIGKDIISSDSIALYGALVHFFVKPVAVTKSKNDDLNVDEIIYKKAFQVLGMTMIVGFFISLLVSYFMIQHYASKNAELKLQDVYSNQSYQRILDLEKQKENKLKVLEESGFLSSKFLTFYGYELIRESPQGFSLNELLVIPCDKQIKVEKKINFQSRTIIVKGETFDESSINRWLESLKKMQWVQNFEIISLKKDKKDKSLFEVKIMIKDV
jgi:hypothetical protein